MSEQWNPASLLINKEVVAALVCGEVAEPDRFTGKTETLLAYIALHHDDAIIVSTDVNQSDGIRRRWKYRYPLLREPRFMSIFQFERRGDGLTGTVFTDGVDLSVRALARFCGPLRFGGGVYS